jgi:hypothetical protein
LISSKLIPTCLYQLNNREGTKRKKKKKRKKNDTGRTFRTKSESLSD